MPAVSVIPIILTRPAQRWILYWHLMII